MPVKIFISWSGKKSSAFAEILREWIPSVIQAAKPYYSTNDVAKGTRWSPEMAKELEESQIGIICMTRDNLQESWIMFEAGALSKNLGISKVCPVLFGLESTDLRGPLVQFQAARFNNSEIKRLMSMINRELGSDALPGDIFDSVFNKWWADLDKSVQVVLEQPDELENKSPRSERDLLEEILELTRGLSGRTQRSGLSYETALRNLVVRYKKIVLEAIEPETSDDLLDEFASIAAPINYLVDKLVTGSVRGTLLKDVKSATDFVEAIRIPSRQSNGRSTGDVDLNEEDFDDIPF